MSGYLDGPWKQMMNYYQAKFQYDGTLFAGFQWQNGLPTVQSEINLALSKLISGKITTRAASRTDTGVHAFDQKVKITSEAQITLSGFLISLNKLLPLSIRCLEISSCAGTFNPSTEAVSKEYRYFFTNKKQVSIEDQKFVANFANDLNIEEMNKCIQALLGKHDFCNFCSSGSNVKTTIREVSLCTLSEVNPQDTFLNSDIFIIPNNLTKCFELKIVANGFIKQMIRHLVSALWMVGSGKLSAEEFIRHLNEPKINKQQRKVAPPNGLFLYKINY